MSDAKFEAAERPLDETFSGPEYRTWRDALLLEAAKFTDKSGSSLADHLEDSDMFGSSANAIPDPPQGTQAQNQVYAELQRLVPVCPSTLSSLSSLI